MKYYLQCLRNYAVFSGRARRKEFWLFALFNFIFAIVAMIIDHLLGTTFKMHVGAVPVNLPYGWIYLLYCLAVLIPSLAVSVRRLHDRSKSGWFILITFIPLIGAIWYLVVVCTDSVAGTNIYGPNPKESQTTIQ